MWLIYKQLKKLVYQTWFDEEGLASDIAEKLFKNILQAKVATIYNTQRHHKKTNSTTANHNCKLEFDYASRKETRSTVVAVFMEKWICGADGWTELFAFGLDWKIYVYMSGDLAWDIKLSKMND